MSFCSGNFRKYFSKPNVFFKLTLEFTSELKCECCLLDFTSKQ
jgi:hypothetical protein